MALGTLAVFAMGAPAWAQPEPRHGGRLVFETGEDGAPSPWVQELVNTVNEAMAVEQWLTKEAMQGQIAIEFFPVRDEEPEAEDESDVDSEEGESEANSIRGKIAYDVQNRRLRFDDETGMSFLVERCGHVNIWKYGITTPLEREDVPDETLNMVRALPYLIALPLRLNDDDVRLGAGRYTRMLGEEHFMSFLGVFDDVRESESEESEKDEENGERESRERIASLPPDWFAYFVDVRHPHRLHVIGYLVHDRSKRLTEIPMPRAVKFEEYEVVAEIPLPVEWTLWDFSRREGFRGDDAIGKVGVREIAFVERAEGMFDVPEGALRVR